MDHIEELRALKKNPILQTSEEYVVCWNALVTLANEAADVIVRLRSRVAELDQQTVDLMRGFKDCDDRRLTAVAEVERFQEDADKRDRAAEALVRAMDEIERERDEALAQVAIALISAVEWTLKRLTRQEEWPMSWEAKFPGLKAQAILDLAPSLPIEARALLDRLHRTETVAEAAKMARPLAERLADLIVREDIPDEDLQEASETLLPRLHDFFLGLNAALAAWEEGTA